LPANPGTVIDIDPMNRRILISDTKDNDIELIGLEASMETKSIKVEKFTVRNNASDPRLANARQIDAYTAQVVAVTHLGERALSLLESMIPYALPQRGASSSGIGFDPATGRIDLTRTGGGTSIVPIRDRLETGPTETGPTETGPTATSQPVP
jgi:hypothetical protein